MKDFGFYKPNGLDLKSLIPNLPDIEYDKLHYLIHLIYEQKALYKIKTDFVPLKALYLRKILRDHKIYRTMLEDAEIIECDYTYVKNSKSYGLRLTEKYQNLPYCIHPCKTNKVRFKINRWKLEKSNLTDDTHIFLREKLLSTDIDEKSALDEIKNYDFEKQNCIRILINKIKTRDWYFLPDEYGRIHTNLTILPKKLRKFLTVKNKSLVTVDITNSQPLFLLILLKQNNNIDSNTIRCAKHHKWFEELELYSSLVQSGKLYEFMSFAYENSSRELTKKLVFKDIFGPTLSPAFKTQFPCIGAVLQSFKKKDYRSVAWMLQRQESKLMISNVCGKLKKLIPSEFISTIHDSILTTPDCVDVVTNVVREAFLPYDVIPTLKVEEA